MTTAQLHAASDNAARKLAEKCLTMSPSQFPALVHGELEAFRSANKKLLKALKKEAQS
jgi:hypothetical protein